MVDNNFVDGMAVQIRLMEQAKQAGDLPADLHVFTKTQDDQSKYLPALVMVRSGGASLRPEFQSDYFMRYLVWSGVTTEFPNDPYKAAEQLSLKVARALYAAKKNQTVALDVDGHALGWIADWRESSGFQDFSDASLPNNVGRYLGVYDLKIRNRRPKSV